MATSSEAKTLALCDFCDEATPTKFCQNCGGTLCNICATDHVKTKIFRDHVISDINDQTPSREITRPRLMSGEAECGLSKCPKHLNQDLDSYCGQCSCFICEMCKSDHVRHPIQSAKDDIQLYHRMCRKHIQCLLDGVHDLEEFKQLVKDTYKVYDDAITRIDGWETELLEYIRQQAETLRSELNKEKDGWIKLLSSLKNEAIRLQANADKGVNTLNDVRNTKDCDMLSHKLAASQKLLDEIQNFTEKNKGIPEILKVDEKLPYGSKIPKVKLSVDEVFTADIGGNHPQPIRNVPNFFISTSSTLKHDGMKLKGSIPISKPKTNNGYTFCRGGAQSKSIILHGAGRQAGVSNIHIFDRKNMCIATPMQTCSTNIWEMIYLPNEHYVARNNLKELHLLDQNFISIYSVSTDNGIRALHSFPPGKFLAYHYTQNILNGPVSAFISTWAVKYSKLEKQSQQSVTLDGEIPWSFAAHADGIHVYLCTKSYVYKVSLATKSLIKFELNPFLPQTHASHTKCITTDGDHVLISSKDGQIHCFDAVWNHKVIAKCDSEPKDLLVKDGQLFVSTANSKIFVFQ